MDKKVEEKKKVLKISSTGRVLKPSRKLMTSSDDEAKRPKKKCKSQSMKRMKEEIDRLRLIAQKFESTKDDKIHVNASDNDSEVICEKTKETLSVPDELSSGLKETNLNEILERNRSMGNKVEENKVSKTSSTETSSTILKPLRRELTSSDKEFKRPNKSKSGQSVKHNNTLKQELNRLRLMTKNSGGEQKCINESEKENIPDTFKKLNHPEVITYENSHFSSQMAVTPCTPCTKTKDEELLELGSDTEFASDTNESLHKNTDENNSPSILESRPYLRKRSRLAFYPLKNNANATENSATTLVNNTSEISEDVIYPSPTQSPTLASKVKQYLKLKRKIPVKRIDFGLCPSPKHTSTQIENVSTLKDKVNTSYLSSIKVHNKTDIEDETFYLPAEQTANRNKMDNFNLDDTENKPLEKKMLLNKFNV